MTPIILDFETYYSTDYSLSKMSTEAYVRDPRFEVICVGIQSVKTGHVQMVWGADAVRKMLESLPWEKIALVCQNTAFDGFILAEHYGIYPAMYCDTMSMFRRLYPHKRASLKVIAETLGLPSKGTEIVNAKGKRAKDFTPAEREAFLAYCALDCELTAKAWEILKAGFPVNELRLIDLTISMACKPYLRLNPVPLKEEIAEQKRIKEELLARVTTEKADLMSNVKFATTLQALGVDPPRKISPTALKKNPALAGDPDAPMTWAFGKTDKGMKALLTHDNPEVVALVEARLGVKSTIKETRAESMLGVANRGTLPVNLLYYGAHTGRWSGCLVDSTEVLVYDWEQGVTRKRIVDVLLDDLVWDGEAFVEHDGVKFQGFKEVIEHDGIIGTPDHKVFTAENSTLTLAEAKRTGTPIMDCPEPDRRVVDAIERNGTGFGK